MAAFPRRRKPAAEDQKPTIGQDLALVETALRQRAIDRTEQAVYEEEQRRKQLEDELTHPTPLDPQIRRTALKAAANQGRTITAAVSRVELEGASWKTYKFGDRTWQTEAWRLYDITGQLRFVANWVGNCLSRCILRVHEVDEQGNVGAVVKDPDIAQLGSGPLGVGDSRAESLRLCGIDIFVPGELFMVAEAEGGPDGSDLWWVVTSRQIKKQGDVITIPRSPLHGGGTFVYRDGVDLILRAWTPHPADTNEPDSSTRSAIPDLRKMEAIRKREFAELDSRLTGAGMLFVPDSIDLPRGEDDPEGTDGFSALLMRTMATSLRDRSSAAAMVPIVVQGNAADIDKIKHLTFWSPMSEQLAGMWQNTLVSLAEDLDVPPEVMTGLGGSNHWSAWAVSDSAVTEQIKPVASRIASALTLGYLWPALEALGVDDVTQYAYQFDTALLTTRPNRSADAMTYHTAGLISDDTARTSGAWGEDDAPDDQERARRLAEKLLFAAPQYALSDPGIRQLLALPRTSQPTGSEGQDTTNEPEGTEPTGEENGPPDTQPRATDGRPDDQQNPPPPAAAVERHGLDLALILLARRAMTLAGQRLVPHGQRGRYPGVPSYLLPACHGAVRGEQVPVLLAKAWNDLDMVAVRYQLDAKALTDLMTEFCRELLVRGIAYGDELVADLIASPEVLRRLEASHA
jgi:hypothetical protein